MKGSSWTRTRMLGLAALMERPTLSKEIREAVSLEGETDQDTGGGHKSGGRTSDKDAAPRQMATRTSLPVVTI